MRSILFALLSALGYGATYIFNKKVMVILPDPFRAVGYTNIFLLATALSAVVVMGAFAWPPPHSWPIIIAAGVVGMFALVSLFQGFQHSSVALVATVASTFPFVTYLLSVIFLDAPLRALALTAMVIIVIGLALLVGCTWSAFRLERGVLFGALTAIGWGFFSFSIRVVEDQGLNPFMTIFVIEMAIFLSLMVYLFATRRGLSLACRDIWPSAAGGGILMGLGAIFYSVAVQYGHPAMVASIVSTEAAVAAILAFVVLKEKMRQRQVWGLVTVVVGVILLAW